MARRAASLELAEEDRETLTAWSREPDRRGTRARIVLACAAPGAVNEQVAADLGVTVVTVGKWRRQPARPGNPRPRAVSAGSGRCWVRTNVGEADGFTAMVIGDGRVRVKSSARAGGLLAWVTRSVVGRSGSVRACGWGWMVAGCP